MTTPYVTELPDYQFEVGRDGGAATRILSVAPFTEWPTVAGRLLGGVFYINGQLVRRMPMAHPWMPNCYAKKVRVKGVGAFADGDNPTTTDMESVLSGSFAHAEAELEVEYETNTFTNADWNSGAEYLLVGMTWEFTGQNLTLPTEYYRWKNSTTMPIALSGVNASKTLPKAGVQIVRFYTVNRPVNAILQLEGKVNAVAMEFQDITFPIETMLFEGAQITEKCTWNNVKYYEINYKFTINGIYEPYATTGETLNASGVVTAASSTSTGYVGHNRIYRPDRGFWDYIETTSGTKKIYPNDTDVSQMLGGISVAGFALLIHPQAT